MTAWNPTFFARNVPLAFHDWMKELASTGARFLCVAFHPDDHNNWSIVTHRGFLNQGIPKECDAKMRDLHQLGHKILCVAFHPAGGDRWSIITDRTFVNRSIPLECHGKMHELQNAGHKVQFVAYHPDDNNLWSILTDQGFSNRGIPAACDAKMREFHQLGHKILCVAFHPAGGNRWTILTDKGFFTWGTPPGDSFRVMRAMRLCDVGRLRHVTYLPSGGYVIVSDADPGGQPHAPIVDGTRTFSLDTFAENLRGKLDREKFDGRVVKYGFMMRHGTAIRAWASGPKRIPADPPAQEFTVFDWCNPASVSKTITAVALLRLLEQKQLSVDEPIAKYLPPSWKRGPNVDRVTMKELLSHNSGFRSMAASYKYMRSAVEQGIDANDRLVRQYANSNYGLAAIIVAYLNGHVERGSDEVEGKATSDLFIKYVKEEIIAPLSIPFVEWAPDADDPTLFYSTDLSNWRDFDDNRLVAGSSGAHLSIAEFSFFLKRLLGEPGAFLSSQMRDRMINDELGWGKGNVEGRVYNHKNGHYPGDKNDGVEIHTVLARFETGATDVQVMVLVNGVLSFDHRQVAREFAAAWR